MFKKDKDLTERSNSLLKNKEVKSLRTEIAKQCCGLNEDNIMDLLPTKGSVSITKLANKTLLYSVDSIPYFFDAQGRNDIFPTVFTLWRYPNALTTFLIPGPVSEFILNGADLMLPGVATTSGVYLSSFFSIIFISFSL
jgi:translation initiation factor 2D